MKELVESKLKYLTDFFFEILKTVFTFRMDLHGLVLILCCGTLHSHESVADGVFESVFGLMRDPFSENNWKIKNIKIKIQSTTINQKAPELQTCSSLQQFLALPECEETL